MGLDASLFAIGRYAPDIKDNLDYPSEFYEDTPTGSTIIVLVGGCATTSGSRLLADALGIHPWSFEEHCGISGDGADLELLGEAFENERSVGDFVVLRSHGFKFYYMPNG